MATPERQGLRGSAVEPKAATREPASDAETYVGRVRHASRTAEDRAGVSFVGNYEIAGFAIQIRVVGEVREDYLAAISHLRGRHQSPDLKVVVWDGETSGTDAPSPDWCDADHLARGEMPRLSSHDVRCAYNIDSKVLSVLDGRSNTAFQCVRGFSTLPQYEHGAPLRDILAWWLAGRGLQLIHAAAVGNERGGVLLAGRGGSGKSTTAAACIRAGMHYVSDDYCLAANEAEGPVAYSLYSSMKLAAEEVDRLGLQSSVANPDSGKHLVFVGEREPDSIRARIPLRALLLPRVVPGGHTRLEPVSAARALRALAPSSIFQVPGAGASALSAMAAIVRSLPAYSLELGPDRAAAPDSVSTLLAELHP